MPQIQRIQMQKSPSQRTLPQFQIAVNNISVPKKLQDSTHPTKDLSQYHDCSKLTSLIAQHNLSDCLQCLEDAGYTGDTGVFMLAFIQGGLV